MRLVCPKCAARYEIAEDAIPEKGRDVQCASCGITWFQHRFGAHLIDEDKSDADEPDPFDNRDEFHETSDEEEDSEPVERLLRRPKSRPTDPSVLDILRSEAEREAKARNSEGSGSVEAYSSEPEVAPEEVEFELEPEEEPPLALSLAERAHAARSRMNVGRASNAREEQPAAPKRHRPKPELPDVDELNSSLRSANNKERIREEELYTEAGKPVRPTRRIGFYLAILIALVLVAVYALEPQISIAVPEAEPYLKSYVASTHKLRHLIAGGTTKVLDLITGLLAKYL